MKKKKLLWFIIFIELVVIGIESFIIVPKFIDRVNSPKEKEENTTVEKEKVTPLLYEVTKDGSDNKMYLYGSIHAADASNYEFPDYLMRAYNNSNFIACEYDITRDDLDLNIENYMYQDGTTVKDHMEEETYNMLIKFLKDKNYYNSYYEKFKLMFFSSLLENILTNDIGLDMENGIDMYFINKAKKDNKTILEVESEEFQTNLLMNFPERYYEISIKDLLDDYDESIEQLKELYEAWKKGDLDELTELLSGEITEEDKTKYSADDFKLLMDVEKKLTADRNIIMTEKFDEYFKENKDVLFMVGTAHLVGDDGIAFLLKQKGYTVVQINK